MEHKKRGGLVITRRPGEQVLVETPYGPGLITYTQMNGRQIKLLFEFPLEVRAIRYEAWLKRKLEESQK